MKAGIKTMIYPVEDLAKSKAVFTRLLAVDPAVDYPSYVQFNLENQEIGLDSSGRHKAGATAYLHVADIHRALKVLLEAGAATQQEVTDLGGRMIASVKDADGNIIGLLQPE